MKESSIEPQPTQRKLLDQVRDALRLKHYSYRTEQAYVGWIKRYILFHGKRHPNDMGAPEVEAFLTRLAVEENVAACHRSPRTSQQLAQLRQLRWRELLRMISLISILAQRCNTITHLFLGQNTVNAVRSRGASVRQVLAHRLEINDILRLLQSIHSVAVS